MYVFKNEYWIENGDNYVNGTARCRMHEFSYHFVDFLPPMTRIYSHGSAMRRIKMLYFKAV